MKLTTVAVAASLTIAASGTAQAVPSHLDGSGILTSTTQRTGYSTWETWTINVPFVFRVDYDTSTTLYPENPWMTANGNFSISVGDHESTKGWTFDGAGGMASVNENKSTDYWGISLSPYNTPSWSGGAGINLNIANIDSGNGEISLLSGSSIGLSLNRYANFGGIITFAQTAPWETVAAAAPEPGTWAMMVVGFGFTGFALRSRRRLNPKTSFAAI